MYFIAIKFKVFCKRKSVFPFNTNITEFEISEQTFISQYTLHARLHTPLMWASSHPIHLTLST
jgi:hypothetical protein